MKAYLLALLLIGVTGCRTGRSYIEPDTPRYAGSAEVVSPGSGDTLLVVSWNIEYALETRRAIRLLEKEPGLRGADILLLQEMTGPATRMVAQALGMHYVYYPAIYNRIVRRDVGNAVLSRWPIAEDRKLILPGHSRYAKTQRIATAVTVTVGDRLIRVYSTHLGTPADLGHAGRTEQLRFILADAAKYSHVIVGGDMNSADIGEVARVSGYAWPTDTIPASSRTGGRLDHFFIRGFSLPDDAGTGTVSVSPVVSDHNAIWARLLIGR
jgi:endonuclease/exonuclease/phosphatase family metal-dependent hydrolase